VKLHTTAGTTFEIDGETYVGGEGLEALSQQAAGTRTIAFGVLSRVERAFTAERVHAGASTPGPRFDVLEGNVIARDGDSLTVRGGTLIRRGDSAAFVRGDISVLVGTGTRVVRDGANSAGLGTEAISVGQRIHAFGEASGEDGAITLDASEGRVRLQLTHLSGIVVAAEPGYLDLDLAAIDGRRPSIFDFAGTGFAPELDADPDNYEVATGALDLAGLAAGAPARVFGFVTPFGASPPDFVGRTVVDLEEIRALLGIGWGLDGTAAPFLSLGGEGLVVDNANPDIGLRHHIRIGPRLVDVVALPVPLTVAPREGGGLYAIGEPGTVEVFGDFVRFTERLAEKLSAGARARSMSASGHFDPAGTTLTARAVSVALAGTD